MFKLDITGIFASNKIALLTAKLAKPKAVESLFEGPLSKLAISHQLQSISSNVDRCCWPNSSAMNTGEIHIFKERLLWIQGKGIRFADAELLVDSLVNRDRFQDERKVCLECLFLLGTGRWKCGNCRVGGIHSKELPSDFVKILQRCSGFKSAVVMSNVTG